jgi:hypothetical protein
MKSKRNQVIISIFMVSLFIVGCTQNNVSDSYLDIESVIEETEVVSPTEVVVNTLEPTETPTQEPLPTASIEFIEYYYSEFEDLADWDVFYKNVQSSYFIDFADNGLSLSLDALDDYYLAYSNVFGTNTVIEIEFGFLDGSGPVTYQLICRSSDIGEYVFEIDSEGSWEIEKYNFDTKSSESLGDGVSELIATGYQQNNIIVECDQDELSLTVNDVLIEQIIDQSYMEGYAGFAFRNEGEDTARVSASYFFVTAP